MVTIPPNTEEEKKLIQRAYRRLLRTVKSNMKPTDRVNIRKAYELAVDAHHTQRRKSGEPYILHPIEVARICVEEIGLGPTAIISALLHDVVEDTDITLEYITKEFGGKISMIVDGLTKFKELDSDSPQAENFKKVLSTMSKDVRVVLIKMADRLHNMRTLGSMPPHKQLKIASETNYIYAPLAHRLGLYNMKTEFQDLCMKSLNSEDYQWVAKKLDETKRDRNQYINEFIKPLENKLNDIGVPYKIYGRPKSISSIWNKVKAKGVAFEDIYDLFAIRILVDVPLEQEKSACWQVYTIVTETNTPIPERLKDWITTPKANGYESLHTTVVGPKGRYVEVQIRSERMHEIAEKGFAAHWKYKGIKQGNMDVFSVWLDNIREILDNPGNDPVEFLRDFKTNLFKEEIYVYTPKGDMRILPHGATALDFAFFIHSEVGYRCKAVKVNNVLVPLGHELKSGDQVSVVTNKAQKPSENWLNYVVTGKARSKIRSSMKEERRKKGEMGKETLMRKMKNIKADFETNADIVVKYFNFQSRPDLYYAIFKEEINIQQELKNFSVEGGRLTLIEKEEPKTKKEPSKSKTKSRRNFTGKPSLMIDNQPASQLKHSLATCCNPVLGDPVFAYITVMGEAKIHRNTCPNAEHLMANYAYRMMKAEWIDSENTDFIARIMITGIDGRGVAQKITGFITNDLKLDMRSISMDGNQGFFQGKISIVVKNKDQLHMTMKALKEMDGVYSVIREE
ncbi:MAG: guanosine-3',5'-bis(diphosphate) 3'-pyrophosphohydrolase [Maribacter sp.]|jgi:guanosine-3',5'-bis(diphosphate) 3'-pyrophosphohydrolase